MFSRKFQFHRRDPNAENIESLLSMTHFDKLFQHVVFGSVVEGMNVVKDIEKVGSQSGKTSRPVKIEACGQL